MLLTKRKIATCRLLGATKAQRRRLVHTEAPSAAALDHEKQLAVVDAVEWAVERWASRDLLEHGVDPRAVHAARLVAALVYLDARFEHLDPAFVVQVIEGVASSPPEGAQGPRLDAKAAAALLTVEVRAFRR